MQSVQLSDFHVANSQTPGFAIIMIFLTIAYTLDFLLIQTCLLQVT